MIPSPRTLAVRVMHPDRNTPKTSMENRLRRDIRMTRLILMARSLGIGRSVMPITSPLHSRLRLPGPEDRLSQFFDCHKRVGILWRAGEMTL